MYESYGLSIDGRWRQAADGIREYLEPKTLKTVI